MQAFKFLIATPETILFQDEIVGVILPGEEGFFEVLANHAAIIALIKAGTVTVIDKQQNKHSLIVKEGFFEFYKNQATLLSH